MPFLCIVSNLIKTNPIGAIDKVKLVDKAPEILTPEQLFGLLSAAPCDLLPVLAIQAFAGLRTEIVRLDWSEIDQVGLVNSIRWCYLGTAGKFISTY
jgi:integrase